jgi:hypothetical protein
MKASRLRPYFESFRNTEYVGVRAVPRRKFVSEQGRFGKLAPK